MIYKCKLLKDLPDFPAGTVFYASGNKEKVKLISLEGRKDKYDMEYHRRWEKAHQIGAILSKPEWYSKEPNKDSALALNCPKCPSVTAQVRLVEADYEDDADVRYYFHEILVECILCEHVYSLGKYRTGSYVTRW